MIDVLDSDTIVVRFDDRSTDTVRLLGVNTPKVDQHHLRTEAHAERRFWTSDGADVGGRSVREVVQMTY